MPRGVCERLSRYAGSGGGTEGGSFMGGIACAIHFTAQIGGTSAKAAQRKVGKEAERCEARAIRVL